MNLGAVVDVAIGIIFVWIVLSLTTIQIQEWITTRLDKRAKDLESAIEEMLANENLKAQFFDHPVIRGLTARKRKAPSKTAALFYRLPIVRGFTKEKRMLPSYIPKQEFAAALFDIALTAGTKSSLVQQGLLKIRNDLQKDKQMTSQDAVIVELNLLIEFARSAAATEAGTAITKYTFEKVNQEAQNFAVKYPEHAALIKQMLEDVSRLKGEMDEITSRQPVDPVTSGLTNLRRGIAALSVISPEINQTLNALLMNVEEYVTEKESHLAKARENVEKWFDDAMDRASGVFKRYSQAWALFLGLLVALVFNVDSISITSYLWRDSSVRQALADNAAKFEILPGDFTRDPEQAMQDLREKFVGLSLPAGWEFNETTPKSIPDYKCQLFPKQFQTFGVHIPFTGWCIAPLRADNKTNMVYKAIGILITAFAARLGAPFWFDVLKRLVNLRGTGPNPVEKEGK
jgi:hypothetical protein